MNLLVELLNTGGAGQPQRLLPCQAQLTAHTNTISMKTTLKIKCWSALFGLMFSPEVFSQPLLYDVAYGNGVFVAVGDAGTVLTSVDKTNWISRFSGTSNGLYALTYGNGVFVAVAPGKVIFTSQDGDAWSRRDLEQNFNLVSVTYGNDLFVAVQSGSSTFLTSSNGFDWAPQSGDEQYLREVRCCAGLFIAVGWPEVILTSTNGTSWTRRRMGGEVLREGVVYGMGAFIAVGTDGTILTSSDAIEWVAVGSWLQFTSANFAAHENDGMATIIVQRVSASSNTVTVDYSTTPITASPGQDYIEQSGTLTFASGETEKAFTVPILNDELAEGAERIRVTLSHPTGGALLSYPNEAVLTIVDDEPPTFNTIPLKPLAAGIAHTVALKIDGSLWAWGDNSSGQLGDGTTSYRDTPVHIAGCDWAGVVAGYFHTLALKSDHSLWAWGYNDHGQLGNGTFGFGTNTLRPMRVGNDFDWTEAAAGPSHTLARKIDGSLWAWGLNNEGQLGDGTEESRNSPVRVGTDNDWKACSPGWSYTLALKADGSLWVCWSRQYSHRCAARSRTCLRSAASIRRRRAGSATLGPWLGEQRSDPGSAHRFRTPPVRQRTAPLRCTSQPIPQCETGPRNWREGLRTPGRPRGRTRAPRAQAFPPSPQLSGRLASDGK